MSEAAVATDVSEKQQSEIIAAGLEAEKIHDNTDIEMGVAQKVLDVL